MSLLFPAILLSLAVFASLQIAVDALVSIKSVRSVGNSYGNLIVQRVSSLNVRNVVSAEGPIIRGGAGNVETEVMSLKASEIKRILTSLNANTRGLYDKEELAKLLIQIELESLSVR